MATAVIPALLRKYTAGVERVEVRGRNLGELIDALEEKFPGLRNNLIEDGELKGSVAVSIDGETATSGLLESVREDSEVHFLPAIGGGCQA